MKREKTIPTLIGLAVLSISLAFGLFLTGKTTSFLSKASGNCEPKNIKITNISHYSVTVSFTTTDPCLCDLNFDNKIVPGDTTIPLRTHYFEPSNLKENTEYNFNIISGGKSFTSSEYKAKTAKKPTSSTPNSRLAWGKVFYSDLKPAAGSIVYLSIPAAAPISSFVTENGYWYISLATSFNKTLTSWFVPVDNIVETFEVVAPDLSKTTVAGNTSSNNPVPDIIIGKNQSTPPPAAKNIGGDLKDVSQSTAAKSLTIQSPKESETINTKRPDVFGTAATYAIIVFNVGAIKDSVQAGIDGTWHWYPQTDFSTGLNSLTAKSGSLTVTRNFFISADASSLAFTASGSAMQISPSPTSSLSLPTSSPSPISSVAPTSPIVPTSSVAPSPTTTIIRTAKTATGSGVPVTGNTLPTVICLIISFGLVGSSLLMTKRDRNQV